MFVDQCLCAKWAIVITLFPTSPRTVPSGGSEVSQVILCSGSREGTAIFSWDWETWMHFPMSFQLFSYSRKTDIPPCGREQLRSSGQMASSSNQEVILVFPGLCLSVLCFVFWQFGISFPKEGRRLAVLFFLNFKIPERCLNITVDNGNPSPLLLKSASLGSQGGHKVEKLFPSAKHLSSCWRKHCGDLLLSVWAEWEARWFWGGSSRYCEGPGHTWELKASQEEGL